MSVPYEELAKISFLDATDLDDRFLKTLLFHADGRWWMWAETDVGLIEMNIAAPAEGGYFAAAPERADDFGFRFLNLFVQKANFLDVGFFVSSFEDDFYNLLGSLKKLEFLFQEREKFGHGVTRVAKCEIELAIYICRSIFDIIQEIFLRTWERITLLDQTVKKKRLKKSFSDMVLFGGVARTVENYTSTFGIPVRVAEFYVNNSEFFLGLRTLRDKLIHSGHQMPSVFVGERGFLVREGDAVPTTLEIYTDDDREEKSLVSLHTVISALIFRTLGMCEDFADAISSSFKFPEPVVPGMNYYIRTYFNEPSYSAFVEIWSRLKSE